MAELFSEVNNCYYQVIKSLIRKQNRITEKELARHIRNQCFEESILYLLPKLTEDGWGFYKKQDGRFGSRLSKDFFVPLTNLQKSYLKAILMDEKTGLFFSEEEIKRLKTEFQDIKPLYLPEDFCYYDRFSDKDDYKDPDYRKHFQMILQAVEQKEYLDILYESHRGRGIWHRFLPCRLEYSIKNDRFRLLAVKSHAKKGPKLEILRVSRIKEVVFTHKTAKESYDMDQLFLHTYCREPVKIIIKNRRNALERAMLQFADYRKSTRKINADTYECLIYYNKKMETELLIEILSFGPMIKVVGNEEFLRLVKRRIRQQAVLLKC